MAYTTRTDQDVDDDVDQDTDVIDLTEGASRMERLERDEREQEGDVGRDAERPRDIPRRGWVEVARRVKDSLRQDQVPLMSAGVAFFLLLALFPSLAAVVSIYGLVADPAQVQQQVTDLVSALPQSAQELITEQLESIVGSTGGGLGFGIAAGLAGALWSVSSGMQHLITAVNAAYDQEETRGFLALRGSALLFTLGAIVFGVISIGILAVLPAAIEETGLGSTAKTAIQVGTYPALAVAFAFGVALLYRYAPDRHRPKWRWISPGALLATVIWIIASLAFSFYTSNFGSYGETYGTIGAVIVLMLWLVITTFSVMLGAELDSELEAQTDRPTSTA